MPSVDNRIVEMRFDNKDFQTGVSESISSLDKLKRSLKLKDSADGFDEIGRAAESVTHKFSALGTIGDQILRNIGNEVYNLKNQFVDLIKSMSVDQITAGWNKYGEKTASVQTILNATGKSIDEVNSYLDRLMTYSDETSFGFTDMTSALQTMTASGGDLEKLIPMLMGMGNAVAFAGKGAAEFKRVMAYGLNQAYSLGYLGTKDWMSFQGAGVNSKQLQQTFIDIVNAKNKAQYELKDFSTLLTKKLITKDVMEDALGRFAEVTLEAEKLVNQGMFETFSEAYEYLGTTDFASLYDGVAYRAAKAAQEAKTFIEAIDATKDAVSSGWMDTFEKIFGNYEEAKVNWTWLANELWSVFASGAEARNDMLQEWKDKGGFDLLWLGIRNLWNGLRDFGSKIGTVWKQLFPDITADQLYSWTEKFVVWTGKVQEYFSTTFGVLDTVSEAVDKYKNIVSIFGVGDFEVADDISDVAENISGMSDEVSKLVKTMEDLDDLKAKVLRGDFGVGENRRKAVEDLGYSYEYLQNKVSEVLGYSDEYKISQEDLDLATGIFNGTIKVTSENMDEAAESISDLSSEMEQARTWITDLRDVLGGFKSALDLLIEVGKAAAKYIFVPGWNFLVEVFKKLLNIIAPFSRAFSDFVAKIKETGAIDRYVDSIKKWFDNLKDYLKEKDNIKKFLELFERFKTSLSGLKDKGLTKLTEFFDKLANGNIGLPSFEKVGNIIDKIVGFLNKILSLDFSEKSPFTNLDFSSFENLASSLGKGLVGFVKGIFSDSTLIETILSWIRKVINAVVTEAGKLKIGKILMTILGVNAVRGVSGLLLMPKAITDAIWGLGEALEGKAIQSIAISIGILVASLVALSLIPYDRLNKAVAALLVVMGALVLVSKLMGVIGGSNNKNKTTGLSLYLLSLSISLLLLTPVLATLSALPLNKLLGAVLSIMVLMASFAVLSKYAKSNGSILVVAASFAVMAVALDLLIPILGTLAGLAMLKNNALLLSILSIVALMAAFSVLSKYAKSNGSILVAAASFAMMAIALDLLIPILGTLAGLAMLKNNALLLSILSIAALMAAFAVLSKYAKSNGSILVVAASFAVIAIALDLLIPILGTLAGLAMLKNNALLLSILSIVALMAAFAVLSKYAKSNGSILTVAASFAVMAIALDLLIPIINTLASLDNGKILVIVAAISLLMGVFVALGAIVGKFDFIANGVAVLGVAFGVFSAAILLAGVGALAFAKALQILSSSSVDAKVAGKNLAEGIVAFFDEIVANGKSILIFVGEFIGAIIAVLALNKSKIVDLASGLINAIGAKTITGLLASKGLIIAALAIILAGILEYFGVQVDVVIDTIFKLIIMVINGLAKAIMVNSEYIWKAILNLLAAIFKLVADGLFLMIDGIAGLFGWDTSGLREKFDQFLNIDGILEDLDQQQADLRAGVQANVDSMKESANLLKQGSEEAADTAKEAGSNLQYFADPAVAAAMAMTGTTELGTVKLAAKETGEAAKEGLFTSLTTGDNTPAQSGENFDLGFGNAIVDNMGISTDAASLLGDSTGEALAESLEINSPSKLSDRFGKYMDQGLANGMDQNTALIRAAIKTISDVINEEFELITQRMKDLGKNSVEGYVRGIDDNLYLVVSESRKMGRLAVKSTAKEIDSNSPAKEFGKLGKYSAQGYANELSNNTYLAEDAATSLGEDTLSAFNSVISRIYDAINGDFDMSPVIRPVLDLSEIQNGQGRIASVLGTGTYGFSPNMQYSMIHANNVMASVNADGLVTEVRALRAEVQQLKSEQSRNNIPGAINGIRKDIGTFNERLGQMRVVLDDGTLVGHIDTALGQRTRLARRGV